MIPRYELRETPRFDLVDAGGHRWLAVDHRCPRPGCNCGDTLIEFMHFHRERPNAEDVLGTISFHAEMGAWEFEPEKPQQGPLLRECWRLLSDRFGDVARELERRREKIAETFGPLIVKAEQGSRARKASPAAKVGRNDPCLCGSGKKFKKCCGAE